MSDVGFEAVIERMDRRADARDERFLERMSRSEQHFIDALAENSAEIKRIGDGTRVSLREMRESMGEMRESLREMRESLREMRDSIQANTQAVLFVIDRMDRLDGGTA